MCSWLSSLPVGYHHAACWHHPSSFTSGVSILHGVALINNFSPIWPLTYVQLAVITACWLSSRCLLASSFIIHEWSVHPPRSGFDQQLFANLAAHFCAAGCHHCLLAIITLLVGIILHHSRVECPSSTEWLRSTTFRQFGRSLLCSWLSSLPVGYHH